LTKVSRFFNRDRQEALTLKRLKVAR